MTDVSYKPRHVRLAAAVGAALATSVPHPTHAQESAASGLEEIVVTARKREERLSTTPVAVSAMGIEQLQREGLRDLEDLSQRTPGVYFSNQGGQLPGRYNSAVRFRGMDTNQQAASQQLGTVFLDGIYVSQAFSSLAFDNLERVEVIRGPQSATFGRSTFGGAVNYITRAPSFETTGKVTADVAQFGTHDVTASVETGLFGDTVAVRIGARSYATDGQYRSATDGGRLGEESTKSGELSLLGRWGGTEARARVLYSEDDDGPPTGFLIGGSATARGQLPNLHNCYEKRPELVALRLPNYFCGELPKVDPRRYAAINTNVNQYLIDLMNSPSAVATLTGGTIDRLTDVPRVDDVGLKRDVLRLMGSLRHNFEGALDGHSVLATYGYNKMRVNWIRDFDQTQVLNFFSSDPQNHKDYSVELRWEGPTEGKFRWLVGANYFNVKYRQDTNGGTNVYNAFGDATPFGGIATPIVAIEVAPVEAGETLGFFGSATYQFTPKLDLTVELRRQTDKISQDNLQTAPKPDYEDEFKATLPRVTLSYRPTDDSTVWATYSKGNLPGFFNTQLVGRSQREVDQIIAVIGPVGLFNEEETLSNYELGTRWTLADGRVQTSLVAYYMEWRDLKTRVGVPITLDSGAPTVASVQTNIGSANMRGLELEVTARVLDRLTAFASGTWADGEYTTFICGFAPFYPVPGKDCAGNRPPRFPNISGSVGLDWQDSLTNTSDYFVRADASYLGKSFTDETNFAWVTPGTTVNLRTGIEKDAWRAEAYVRNLFGNDNYRSAARMSDFSTNTYIGFASNQAVAVTPAEKRTAGVRVSYQF
jgi:iron complex outermembrane receptor protein